MTRHVRRTSRREPLSGARRRTQLRRVGALGGMLVAVGGLVTLRSTLAPSSTQALSASGLAVGVSVGEHSPNLPPSPGPSTGPNHPARRLITGRAYDVGYGVVQVRVTLVGNHLADVSPVSLPQGGRSGDISSYAAPQLRREALNTQSAQIDTVSGASYTSAGYAESLQSALDKVTGG